MRFGSKSISLFLALVISLVNAFVFYFFPAFDFKSLGYLFVLNFLVSFFLIKIVLELFFFQEIGQVYELFSKVKEGKKIDATDPQEKKVFLNASLSRLNEDISKYAGSKQDEIDALKKMEVFRREFMADVSHELKTPIFSAQGFIHTLIDGAIEDKKVRGRFLKKAANSLEGLEILVQDLLTISQMEAGEIMMDFKVFDIIEMVKDIFEQLEEKAEEGNVKLVFDKKVTGEAIHIYADNRRIEQVMRNLIVNGIFYSNKDGGEVAVGIEGKSGKVRIFVRDQGLGIAKEDQSRIFERFYRVEKSRSKVKGGTGLGLSIVKHIIEAHNSNVLVSSTIDKGSTFSFVLERGDPLSLTKVSRR